jgi:hypothetical protein
MAGEPINMNHNGDGSTHRVLSVLPDIGLVGVQTSMFLVDRVRQKLHCESFRFGLLC